MDIKQIRYFMWVYEEGSFSRAAQKARVAQPILSMQIRRLEDEFGVQLFERHARGVRPTESGHKLYGRGVSIVEQIGLIEDDFLLKRDDRLSGRIHVGLSGMFNRSVLKRVLLPFIEGYPDVDVAVSEGYTGTLVEWVRDGIVDFALGAQPQFEGSLVQRLIFSDRIVLLSGSPVCGPTFTECDLTDATDIKLILPTTKHSFGKTCHDYIDQGIINIGKVLEINSTVGAVEIARNSDWAVMASSIAVIDDLDKPNTFIYPVCKPSIGFDLYLVYDRRRPLSPAARQFISMLEEAFNKVRELWKGHPLWR